MKFLVCPCGKEFLLTWTKPVFAVDSDRGPDIRVCSEECQIQVLALMYSEPRRVQ